MKNSENKLQICTSQLMTTINLLLFERKKKKIIYGKKRISLQCEQNRRDTKTNSKNFIMDFADAFIQSNLHCI